MNKATLNFTSTGATGFTTEATVLCVTSSVVLDRRQPVRFVWHDDEDATWHFHQGGPVDSKDRLTVPLAVVSQMDPTLDELRDLPLGWYAERGDFGLPWRRRIRPMDEID